jgi:hypothetical protein
MGILGIIYYLFLCQVSPLFHTLHLRIRLIWESGVLSCSVFLCFFSNDFLKNNIIIKKQMSLDETKETDAIEILTQEIYESDERGQFCILTVIDRIDNIPVDRVAIVNLKKSKKIVFRIWHLLECRCQSEDAIILDRTDDLRADIRNILSKIGDIRFNKLTGFACPESFEYKSVKFRSKVFEALKTIKNIEFNLNECLVCYEVCATKTNCCQNMLCRVCASKLSNYLYHFKCPACRKQCASLTPSCTSHHDLDEEDMVEL